MRISDFRVFARTLSIPVALTGMILVQVVGHKTLLTEGASATVSAIQTMVSALICAGLLIERSREAKSLRGPLFLLGLAFVFEAPADFLYFSRRWIFQAQSGGPLGYLQEGLFAVFSNLMAFAIVRSLLPQLRWGGRLLFALLSVVIFYVATGVLAASLLPNWGPNYFWWVTVIYGVGEALASAGLIFVSSRNGSSKWTFFSIGFLLMTCSSIAIKSADQDFERPLMMIDYAWNAGLAIAASVLWVSRKESGANQQIFEMTPLTSIRSILSIGIFLAIAVAVIGTLLVTRSQLLVQSPALLAQALNSFLLAWTIANALALFISSHAIGIRQGSTSNPIWEFESVRSTQQGLTLRLVAEKEQLEKTVRAVAHDIRSPLSAMRVASESALAGDEDSALLMKESVSRLNHLATELLTRAEPARLSMLTLGSIIEAAARSFSAAIRSRSHSPAFNVQYQTESVLAQRVLADADDLHRCLMNLLNNAADAVMEKADPIVRLAVTPVEEGYLEVAILDNGPGFSKGMLDRIKRNEEVSSKAQGHGLGLGIVRNILKDYGSQLRIERLANGFTKVSFRVHGEGTQV